MKVHLGSDLHSSSKFPTQVVDVNTTHEFGHLQPVSGCFELVPGSTLKIKHSSVVRFTAMPFPTYGRASLRTYYYSVPIADVWHPFESMLAGQPYFGAGRSYVPAKTPQMPIGVLTALVLSKSFVSIYEVQTGRVSRNRYKLVSQVATESVFQAFKSSFYSKYCGSIYGPELNDTLKDYVSNTFIIIDGSDGRRDSVPSSADATLLFTYDSKTYIACLKLSQTGEKIRKVLIGSGFQLSNSPEKKTILNLVAFLKVFYDYWFPKRDFTWKGTNTFHMMESIEQYDLDDVSLLNDTQYGFYQFIEELADTYFYQNPDYFTSQITGMANTATTSKFNLPAFNGTEDDRTAIWQGQGSQQAHLRGDTGTLAASAYIGSTSWAQLKALEFLSKFINKNTAIGGRIDEYLRVHHGAQYKQKDDSYFIGVDTNQVTISDVMSNAGTENTVLGDYAGFGIGSQKADQEFTVHTDTFCYLIAISVLVPESKFTQGVDPNLNHRSRFDFYLGSADGLTLLPTPVDSLYGSFPSGKSSPTVSTFGNQAIYSEYKMRPLNILNGQFSRLSTFNEYRGYTLDKLFSVDHFVPIDVAGTTWYEHHDDGSQLESVLSADLDLRSIGKNTDFENFDRIFYNSNTVEVDYPIVDNAIVHNTFVYDLVAPMLPYSDSFDTDAFKNGLTVEKA